MATATIKLVDGDLRREFFFNNNTLAQAREYLAAGHYHIHTTTISILDLQGAELAEEMFDLTNNPGRQAERERVYGRGRSVSVGDIVNVDGVDYVCCDVGWVSI
jgi:hypothetical protein